MEHKWEIRKVKCGNMRIVCGSSAVATTGIPSLLTKKQKEANAKLIVDRVNGWDELEKQRDALLKACKEMVLHWYGLDNDDEKAGKSHCMIYCQNLIEEAIALCEK